jgi:hypothetical protein
VRLETLDLQPEGNNGVRFAFCSWYRSKEIAHDRVQVFFGLCRGGEKVIEKCEVPEPKKSLIFWEIFGTRG